MVLERRGSAENVSGQKDPGHIRIGVDASCWLNDRGYGRFARELISHMVADSKQVEFVCFMDRWTMEVFGLDSPNVRVVCVKQSEAPSRAAAADGYRTPFDMYRMVRAVTKESPDVFFFPSVYTYYPLPSRIPSVVTIHDAIPERFPDLTFPSRRARLFWNIKLGLAVRQAKLILAVSDFASKEIQSFLGVREHRIRVINEAPASVYRPSQSIESVKLAASEFGVPDGARWIVYVGGFNPHKHVDTVIRSHAAVSKELEGAPLYLLLVGSAKKDVFHKEIEQLYEAVSEGGASHLVIWTGFVPDAKLRHLLSGAVALVMPSACEGFGLPAVEAAACGTPVIATTESPLPDLLEGGGIFVPPGDESELASALKNMLQDENYRSKLGIRASERASSLSWEESARTTMSALKEVTD